MLSGLEILFSVGRRDAPLVPTHIPIDPVDQSRESLSAAPARALCRARRQASAVLRLHAQGIIACDWFVAVTVTFRQLYVFVVLEHRSRPLVHCNVTAQPTAAWTLQQLREVVGYPHQYEFLLHDRDSVFASHLDESIRKLRIRALKSPPRSPKANATCERVIGTIRRECLDWLIPLSESHLRSILKSWVPRYNGGRPHMALGSNSC